MNFGISRLGAIIGGAAVLGLLTLIALSLKSSSEVVDTPTTTAYVWNTARTTASPTSTSTSSASTSSTSSTTSTPAVSTSSSIAPATNSAASSVPSDQVSRVSLRIQALNAGGRQGVAGIATDLLRQAGYTPLKPKDTDITRGGTTVLYAPGQHDAAVAAAGRLFISPDNVRVGDITDPNWRDFGNGLLDVLVVYGRD
ncbi:MAG TPA: LytR C-terminal domain-containing protein [Ilumatobacteraceae bacterium]|nr:LytR C-terminal domain-containing protein [Ilumatobacteraceae bacterium]